MESNKCGCCAVDTQPGQARTPSSKLHPPDLLVAVGGIEAHEVEHQQGGQALQAQRLGGLGRRQVVLEGARGSTAEGCG